MPRGGDRRSPRAELLPTRSDFGQIAPVIATRASRDEAISCRGVPGRRIEAGQEIHSWLDRPGASFETAALRPPQDEEFS